jgi:predicted nucleic acid binding AN1-type Zn finger protein
MSQNSDCRVCDESLPRPHECNYCGHTHCMEHRLPENHECPGLDDVSESQKWFDESN